MKILIGAVMLFIIGCNTSDKKENASMPGAYKMLSQHVKSDSTDTTYTSLQQMKIYTDDYMMYVTVNSPDSVSSFGIGTYTSDKDTVTENVIYSASDTSKNETAATFKLVIEKTGKGYKQIIPDMLSRGQHITLTEEYESAGTATKSLLDGAWKQTKSYWVTGKDTTVSSGVTQFKTYYAGHVIWGNTYADSASKIHTSIGFGTFVMNGDNKVKESMTASSIYQVRGHDFDMDITMNGTDGFTQTMNNKDGSKSVEIYERLKK
ncbi:MAG: hypothetical protein JWO92_491 [Chitinophagaceae bacterium]|nr:hypothetical protein [Chitinophagaceae bacterium]